MLRGQQVCSLPVPSSPFWSGQLGVVLLLFYCSGFLALYWIFVAEWIGRYWWSLKPLILLGSAVFELVPERSFLDLSALFAIAVLRVLYPLEQDVSSDAFGLLDCD